jgi:hypothetical protein
MVSIPSPTPRTRRAYDHRLREHVVRSGASSLARHLPIPRSTVSTWQRRGLRPVVTVEIFEQDRQQLLESIVKLDRRARVLAAVVPLLLALFRVSGVNLAGRRHPEGAAKADVLRAIESVWRWLKHQWLCLSSLDSIERLRALVEFYVEQHNTQMPHAAFSGQTPDEVYFGTAANLSADAPG